jgi:hypothetical protein
MFPEKQRDAGEDESSPRGASRQRTDISKCSFVCRRGLGAGLAEDFFFEVGDA